MLIHLTHWFLLFPLKPMGWIQHVDSISFLPSSGHHRINVEFNAVMCPMMMEKGEGRDLVAISWFHGLPFPFPLKPRT
jgi:hypothetical protein